jgi:hypothetical protein
VIGRPRHLTGADEFFEEQAPIGEAFAAGGCTSFGELMAHEKRYPRSLLGRCTRFHTKTPRLTTAEIARTKTTFARSNMSGIVNQIPNRSQVSRPDIQPEAQISRPTIAEPTYNSGHVWKIRSRRMTLRPVTLNALSIARSS